MRYKLRQSALAVMTLGAAFGIVQAQAQTTKVENFYVGLNAGAIIPTNISAQVTGSGGGETLTIAGNFNFNTGFAGGGFAGYHVTNLIALEGDFQYGRFDFSSFNGTVTGAGPIATSAVLRLTSNGHVDIYTGLVNGLVTPLGRVGWNGFSPYFGGGAGLTAWNGQTGWNGQINTITAGAAAVTIDASRNKTGFSADAIAGFDFAVSPRISIGGRYQFLWVNLNNLVGSNGSSGSNGDFTGHMLTANATVHF